MVRAFASFLAVSVHIIPAELADDVLELTQIATNAETHIEVGTTFIDVTIWAMITSSAFLFDELRTYF